MKKIKINYRNTEFTLNESVLNTTDYNGNSIVPTITIGRVVGATMIKQYVKKYFPTLKVWTKSDSFSNGNSIDVYVCNNDTTYSEIDSSIYDNIDEFAQSLRMGRFNGMIDMYEHNERDKVSDDGSIINTYCKYISVYNNPKFGTIEWGIKRLHTDEAETPTSILYYIDDNKKDKFMTTVNS